MFNKAMTGGACQPDGTQGGGLSANPLTNMMESMIMGDARAMQNAEGYANPAQAQDASAMAMMEQEFANMQAQEMMARQFNQMQVGQPGAAPQQMNAFQHISQQPVNLNSIWDSMGGSAEATGQSAEQAETIAEAGALQGSQPWMMNNMMMRQGPLYTPPPQLLQQTQKLEAERSATQAEQAPQQEGGDNTAIKEVTSNMVDSLSQSENPKHRNSKFLKFLLKLNHGAYTMEGDQIVKHADKQAEFRGIYTEMRNKWQKEEVDRNLEEEKKEEDDEEQEFQGPDGEKFRNILEGKEELTDDAMQEMMGDWMKEAGQMEEMNKMMEAWGDTWNQDHELKMARDPTVITFKQQNPYLEQSAENPIDLVARARELVEQGNMQEAMLCLEAEVQKTSPNHEAWKLLGQLYQESDQDENAIFAFKEAHEKDPYDLDSLLALGISFTNELAEEDAFNYMHQWLKYHPDYQEIVNTHQGNMDFIEIKKAFELAHTQSPGDTQVLLALGVLMFLQRDFAQAQTYFATAIKEDPLNHSLWNKYGAACAQLLQTQESIRAYKLAIDLRPNYVRTIVNLGLSHNNQANFQAGANCFLNALVLQPELDHVKTYLSTAFIQMKRFDLVEKLKARDMNAFRDEFELVDPNNMQQQSLDELYAHEIFHQ